MAQTRSKTKEKTMDATQTTPPHLTSSPAPSASTPATHPPTSPGHVPPPASTPATHPPTSPGHVSLTSGLIPLAHPVLTTPLPHMPGISLTPTFIHAPSSVSTSPQPTTFVPSRIVPHHSWALASPLVSPHVFPSSSTQVLSTPQPSPSPPPTQMDTPLYSPTAGLSPSTLEASTDGDATLRELRSSMAYYMERSDFQEQQILSLTTQRQQQDELITRLTTSITQQGMELRTLHTRDTNKDILIRTLSEEISRLRTQFEEHSQSIDLRLREMQTDHPVDTTIQERLTTIQSEVQRHSEWVEVARRAPPPRTAIVSETLAESDRRTQRALNLRIRGVEKADAASPIQQAIDFVSQTMGVQDHGVVSAYRAGRDSTRHQPLIIRFRDAQARLAVLRRRGRLRDHPQILLDEDMTPLQWQEHRALLLQRQTARREGLWAVIREGRLITGPMRARQQATRAQPGPTQTA